MIRVKVKFNKARNIGDKMTMLVIIFLNPISNDESAGESENAIGYR